MTPVTVWIESWIELVEAGWNALVDAVKDLIINKAFSDERPVIAPENQYGDGRAGEKIVRSLWAVRIYHKSFSDLVSIKSSRGRSS